MTSSTLQAVVLAIAAIARRDARRNVLTARPVHRLSPAVGYLPFCLSTKVFYKHEAEPINSPYASFARFVFIDNNPLYTKNPGKYGPAIPLTIDFLFSARTADGCYLLQQRFGRDVPYIEEAVAFEKLWKTRPQFCINAYNINKQKCIFFSKEEITGDHFRAACALGGSAQVSVRTFATVASGSGNLPGGRVLSRSRWSTPCSAYRSCQRQTAGRLTPAAGATSATDSRSAEKIIRARWTCL